MIELQSVLICNVVMSGTFKKRVKYLENTVSTSTFLAICLKTYDDEEDVEDALKGLIKFSKYLTRFLKVPDILYSVVCFTNFNSCRIIYDFMLIVID